MKRIALVCSVVFLVAAPAALGSGTTTTTTTSRAQLQGFVCQRALDPAARAVSVTAVMRPVPGTAHMDVRFTLLRRAQGKAQFAPVSGTDLGKWISPTNPTLGQRPGDIWRLVKQVVDLAAGSYRLRVTFRWTDASGQTLATTSRRTPICEQPELRPDLRVSKIAIASDAAATGQDRYQAVIRNTGRTTAPSFNVQLSVASSIAANKTVGPLAPSGKIVVSFAAAACMPSQSISVTADPEHRVDDLDPSNNALSVPCPAASSAPAGSSRLAR